MKIMLTLAVIMAATTSFAADEKPTADKFFAAKCASCHGKDGRGNAKMLKMLKVEAKDLDLLADKRSKEEDAEFTKYILEGKGKKMPAYKAKLNGLDVADLINYIHSLRPAEAAKAAKP